MKRKICFVLLALVFCLSTVFCAGAAPANGYIVDEIGNLTSAEIDILNKVAEGIANEQGIDLFYVYTRAESLKDYDISSLVGDSTDYFVMLENEESWYTFMSGLGENIDAAAEETLREVYDNDETYVGGVKAYMMEAATYIPYIADTPEGDILTADAHVLYDEAELLSADQQTALIEKLMDVSGKYQAEIVVCTIKSMDGGDIDQFVEFLYDSMGFGYGDKKDGVLLLVSMEPRQYRILSNGMAGEAIDQDAIAAISDAIVSDLSDGVYDKAFTTFAERCAYYLDGHLHGFPFDVGKTLIISLGIGAIAGVIVALVLKGQLKSVRKQEQANVYVKADSMVITHQDALFMYRNVQRTEKSSSKSSGSGSSRNVGGGSF